MLEFSKTYINLIINVAGYGRATEQCPWRLDRPQQLRKTCRQANAGSADSGVFNKCSSIGFHGQLVLLIDLEILQVKKIASFQILLSTTDLTIEFSMPFLAAPA